jgi:hypothetical protein
MLVLGGKVNFSTNKKMDNGRALSCGIKDVAYLME